MPNKQFSDDELWSSILKDDTVAFKLLYDRYWLRLYKTASHYLKDTNACEEIVHDVFIIIWNKRMGLKIGHFTNYLNAITRYEVYRHIKSLKLSKVDYTEESIDSNLQVLNEGEVKLNELDVEHQLHHLLTKLPKRSREIFYMSKVQQLSNGEIAEHLGISKHTVENQLTYALKHLKGALKGGTLIGVLMYLFMD